MSAALAVLPCVWATATPVVFRQTQPKKKTAAKLIEPKEAFYRKYTEAMLRRYMRFSLETGRVPSMLGKEMFRGKVTSYRVGSFDDVVIFVHDVDKCLNRLGPMEQLLLKRVAIQEYTHEEASEMLGVKRQTLVRRYDAALDALTALFLEARLLEPLKGCQ